MTDYRGTYNEFREYQARQAVFNQAAKTEVRKKEQPLRKSSPSKDKQLARLEKEISKLEEQIAALDKEYEAFSSDYQKLMELDAEKMALNDKLMSAYESWEELSE